MRSIVALALLAMTAALSGAPAPADCQFHPLANRWQGSCGPLFDENRTLTLAPAKAITTGTWRKDVHPAAVWSGDMTEEGNPNQPIELEIYDGGSGVLRTIYGWFPVTGFTSTAELVSFRIDPSHEVPPSDLDREIVKRAATILSSTSVWNREDNRKCPSGGTKWSIYCAMEQATVDVTGAFNHRRPALEVVREIVDQRSAGRKYHHRLMEYNNDPTTRLEDVQSLFAEALARMKQ